MPISTQRIHYRNDVTRYFLDTEFIEDGRTIDLVSIGIVSDDGCEFYRCNADANLSRANPWVVANVLPHLPPRDSPLWMPKARIRDEVADFLLAKVTPTHGTELVTYYGAYDMVALAQLFGRMVDMPKGIPYHDVDLKQLADELGMADLPPQPAHQHDALEDARWNKRCYEFLRAHRHVRP